MPDDLADSYRMTAKLSNPFEILGSLETSALKISVDKWCFFCGGREVMKRDKIYLNSFKSDILKLFSAN